MSVNYGLTHKVDQPLAKRAVQRDDLTNRVRDTLDKLCEGTHVLRTQWFSAPQVAYASGVGISTVQDRLDQLSRTQEYEMKRPQRATGFKRVYRRKPKE